MKLKNAFPFEKKNGENVFTSVDLTSHWAGWDFIIARGGNAGERRMTAVDMPMIIDFRSFMGLNGWIAYVHIDLRW